MACPLREIANTITKIYSVFVAIGYISETDMYWPPHNSTTLNSTALHEINLTNNAVELLQVLPWARTWNHMLPDAPILDWSSHDEVRRGHLVDDWSSGEQSEISLPSSMIALTHHYEQWAKSLIIDADNLTLYQGACSEISWWNLEPHDAYAALESIRYSFFNLDRIPFDGNIDDLAYNPYGHEGYLHSKIRMTAYMLGWPYNFKKVLWKDTVRSHTPQWEREAMGRYDRIKARAEAKDRCHHEWVSFIESRKRFSNKCRPYFYDDLRKLELERIDKENHERFMKRVACTTDHDLTRLWPLMRKMLPGVTLGIVRNCRRVQPWPPGCVNDEGYALPLLT